jgi:hypothetical protein
MSDINRLLKCISLNIPVNVIIECFMIVNDIRPAYLYNHSEIMIQKLKEIFNELNFIEVMCNNDTNKRIFITKLKEIQYSSTYELGKVLGYPYAMAKNDLFQKTGDRIFFKSRVKLESDKNTEKINTELLYMNCDSYDIRDPKYIDTIRIVKKIASMINKFNENMTNKIVFSYWYEQEDGKIRKILESSEQLN